MYIRYSLVPCREDYLVPTDAAGEPLTCETNQTKIEEYFTGKKMQFYWVDQYVGQDNKIYPRTETVTQYLGDMSQTKFLNLKFA